MTTKSVKSSGTQITQRGVNQGNVLVDPVSGFPIDVIRDNAGVRRLAVQTVVDVGNISLNVELDPSNDGVYIADKDTGAKLIINADGSINANVKVDAADGDTIAISGHLNPIYAELADTITSAVFEEIFSYTSTTNTTRIEVIEATAGTPATFVLKIDGIVKRTLRSSPLERNVTFLFREPRQLLATKKITIEAKVERFILASYDTYTSLEGYL